MSVWATADIRSVKHQKRAALRRLGFWAPTLALAVTLLVIGVPPMRTFVLSIEEAPAVRGERLAAELGCFSCHGPDGSGGVANQKSSTPLVPGFSGERGLVHSKSRYDVKSFILDGAPVWRRQDPGFVEDAKWAALRMPAYGEILSEDDADDLVAYIWLASQRDTTMPADPLARRGAEIAREQGCFHCHGPLGVGGRPNPGSLKGYIPGFWGNDFEELVRDDTELRQWIEAGRLERIAENPIGKRFFERQRVAMPPFGQFLSTEEIEALMAYVRWLHAEGPRRFSQASALPSTECHRCDDVGSKRFANRARAGQEKKG
jgi:mono/diheme cytochrome c family protein